MPLRTVLLLGALTALGSLSIDAYLPSLPSMARGLSTTEAMVQLTLTTFLVGFAAGQAFGGSVSDVFGRRRPVLVALAVYAVLSVACGLAPTIGVLLVARAFQGVVAGAVVVTARAVVRDLHSGPAAARLYSILLLVMGAAPIVGPIAGGQLLHFTSWRGIFLVLAGVTVVLLAVTFVGLRDTLAPHLRRTGGTRDALRTMRGLGHDRVFLGYFLANGFANACVFVWIAGSPFVLQRRYGFSPQVYSLVFALMTSGLIGMSQVNRWLVNRVHTRRLLRIGLTIEAIGAAGALAAFSVHGLSPVFAIIPILAMMSSIGLILPNALALALADHPREAGTATGLMGAPQYLMGAGLAPLVGLGGASNGVPMASLLLALSLVAVGAYRVLTRPGAEDAEPVMAIPTV
jgi:DHA1 family bicyclomycin/chloramphenicol resistance-like MFS transporter